jgi:regulator of sigma E protease
MIVVKILLGLCGLGFVIFIHELGHFIGARLAGITVETFSLGFGKKLLAFKRGSTEYRISLLPLGGYCRLKGEEVFKKALVEGLENIPFEKGAYFSASPLRRIVTAMMGPAFSLLLPVLILSCVWYFGFTIQSQGNRIILASDYSLSSAAAIPGAAGRAGLKTGDRIVAVNGVETRTSADVQESIAPYPNEKRNLSVDRNGLPLTLEVTPVLDTKTGMGKIGVYFWTDPLVDGVDADSASYIAGLRTGDLLTAINGIPIRNTVDIMAILDGKPPKAVVNASRDGVPFEASLVLTYADDGSSNLGLSFKIEKYRTPSYSVPGAVVKGWNEMMRTLVLSVKSLALLFQGVNVMQAISGPVRTTVMVGDVAVQGFAAGFGQGLSIIFNFLSVLSIAIFITQMLPIPALDGGQTLMFLIEFITKKRLKTKFIYYFQLVGTVLVVGLMAFAVFGDVLYLFVK